MGKGTIGVTVGVLAWLGAATAAEAQGVGIDVVGVALIDADDVTCTGIGQVTGATSGTVRTRFYLDNVYKGGSAWCAFSGTTTSFTPSAGISTWGLYAGGQFKTEISIKVNGVTYTDTLTVTVAAADGNYYGFAPAPKKAAPFVETGEEHLVWLDRKSVEVQA